MLSLLLLSTALCDSLLRLRFSFARRACFSEGVRVDAEEGVVADVNVVEEANEQKEVSKRMNVEENTYPSLSPWSQSPFHPSHHPWLKTVSS